MPPLALNPNPPPPTQPTQPSRRPPPTSTHTPSHKKPKQLSPEDHAIMLRYSLSAPTIRSLTLLPRAPPPEEILRCASSATEFRAFRPQPLEKVAFNHINNDPSTRWPLKEPLAEPWHKVYLMAQCEAAAGDYGDRISRPARTALYAVRPRVVKTLGQVLRACADLMGRRRDAVGLRRALETWRAVASGSWEAKTTELLQVPEIGPKKARALVEHGVLTVRQLARLECFHVERLLSRNPPFGQRIARHLANFPRLALAVDIVKREEENEEGGSRNLIVRAVLGCSNLEVPVWKESVPWVDLAAETTDGQLVFFWRGRVESLMSGKDLVFPVEAAKGGTVFVWASCEEIAGTVVTGEVEV